MTDDNDKTQQQYETLLGNSDVYVAAILNTISHALEQRHLSPDAALKTMICAAAILSNDLLDGVDSFEREANDYIEFARRVENGEQVFDA